MGLAIGIDVVLLAAMIIVWVTMGAKNNIVFGMALLAFVVATLGTILGILGGDMTTLPEEAAGTAPLVGAVAGLVGGALSYLIWHPLVRAMNASYPLNRLIAGGLLGLPQLTAAGAAVGYVMASQSGAFDGGVLGINIGIGAASGLVLGALAVGVLPWSRWGDQAAAFVAKIDRTIGISADVSAALLTTFVLFAIAYPSYIGFFTSQTPAVI